jgi:hypothetical protein
MKINRRFLFLVPAVLGVGLASAWAEPLATPVPRVVPPSQFDYHDDHDGRRLADIRLKVIERAGVRSLELVIAAVGPQVEPIPGYVGVRGANRYTAEQLDNIVTGRSSLAVQTQAADGSAPWSGRWRAGRRGTIPERRLQPDGHINFEAVTARDYPLELIVETGGLKEGRQTTELWFDGAPRLRVVYEVAGNQVRIQSCQSLGAEPGENALKPLPVKDVKGEREPAREEPPKPPVTDAEWDARDLEGKWALYQKLVHSDAKNAEAVIPYLARRKDFDFLEMIALHEPLHGGGIDASRALAKADAPAWLRVAAWQRQMQTDYAEVETSELLTKHNPAKALAWLEKYGDEAMIAEGETLNPRFPLLVNPLAKERELLQKRKLKPAGLGKALPPLQPAEVFRHLDAPMDLVDFGDRRRAEPDQVYVHQVLRAIKALVQSARYREPWMGKVVLLTRYTNPEVRRSAFLAFSYLGPNWMDAKNSPVEDFRKVMDDRKEPRVLRESALMAFSSFGDPRVYVRLHEMALETNQPLWRAAFHRVYDIGDEFTLEHLNRLDTTRLAPRDAELLEKKRADLKKWVEDNQRTRVVSRRIVEVRLERAAWAELTNSPVRKSLTAWTRSFFVSQPDDAFEKHLEEVQKKYEPEYTGPDRAALKRQVRDLAKDILSTPRQPKE